MTYRDRLQLEDELKREFFGLLERHTMFRRLPVRKKEEMARAAAWGAIKALESHEVDFVRSDPPAQN